MARTVLFLAVAAVTLALIVGANLQVDPLGDAYHPQALATALEHTPTCGIAPQTFGSDDVGLPEFKLDLVERDQPTVIVVGVSRVLTMRAHPGERGFVNLGIPGIGPPNLAQLFALVHQRDPRRLTVYLDVEPFWFNASWQPFAVLQQGRLGRLRRALSHLTTQHTIVDILRDPSVLLPWGSGMRTQRAGAGCVVTAAGRTSWKPGDGYWRTDGSLDWGAERIAPPQNFVDANQLSLANFTTLDSGRLAEFATALQEAAGYGWRVIGFTPPYDARALRDLQGSYAAKPYAEFSRTIPGMLRADHFTWRDFTNGADLGCAGPRDYVAGDGWHPNGTCAERLRAALDAQARASAR